MMNVLWSLIYLFVVLFIRNSLPTGGKGVNKTQGPKVIEKRLIFSVIVLVATVYAVYILGKNNYTIISNLGESNRIIDIPIAVLATVLMYKVLNSISETLVDEFEIRETLEITQVVTSTKTKLHTNFTPSHARNMLHLIDISEDYIKLDTGREGYYSVKSGLDWSESDLFKEVVRHININIGASDTDFKGANVELEINSKGNLSTLGLVINIISDERLLKFILSSEGTNQREMLISDLTTLNNKLNAAAKKAEQVSKETQLNELNYEIEQLRKNTFLEIENIKEEED